MEDNETINQIKINETNNVLKPINSLTALNNPSEFLTIQNPLIDLKESKSAIIHIKNTCKNSFCNCYVNCCFGHSMIYNTFIKTPKSTKYLFQSVASIKPDSFTCYFKDNIELLANFKSFTKSNSEEIQSDKGNLFAEMFKNDKFNCCNRREQLLMPINIISENRIAGIVRLVYYKDKCFCPFCPCFPCCPCCPCGPCQPCCGCPDCCDCGGPNCCNCKCPNCCNCKVPNCPCCDPKRCCCGLCKKPECCCCDPNRCCCGICKKPECCHNDSCCCCPCPCCCCGPSQCKCTCCKYFNYCAEILDKNNQLKYYVINNNKCGCFCKCLKRRTGLNFNICDLNKKPICTIIGRNKKDFGAFFEDSYSYEVNFPQDADSDTKLTLLNCVYALDTLCVY